MDFFFIVIKKNANSRYAPSQAAEEELDALNGELLEAVNEVVENSTTNSTLTFPTKNSNIYRQKYLFQEAMIYLTPYVSPEREGGGEGGTFWLRMAVLNFRTHLPHVQQVSP